MLVLDDLCKRSSYAWPLLRTGHPPSPTLRTQTNLTCARYVALPCQALSISYVNERAFRARRILLESKESSLVASIDAPPAWWARTR
jgi:hypothetical protein